MLTDKNGAASINGRAGGAGGNNNNTNTSCARFPAALNGSLGRGVGGGDGKCGDTLAVAAEAAAAADDEDDADEDDATAESPLLPLREDVCAPTPARGRSSTPIDISTTLGNGQTYHAVATDSLNSPARHKSTPTGVAPNNTPPRPITVLTSANSTPHKRILGDSASSPSTTSLHDGCRRRSSVPSVTGIACSPPTASNAPVNGHSAPDTSPASENGHAYDEFELSNNSRGRTRSAAAGRRPSQQQQQNGSLYDNCNYHGSYTHLYHNNNNSHSNNNNNNNNNNKNTNSIKREQRKPSYEHNLYPNDFFAKLEGLSPRASTKMQTKVDAVGRITGEWGAWQLRTVLLIFLCKIPSSWFMACIIFTAPAPRHGEFFCKPPNTIGAKNQSTWIKVSHPQKEVVEDQEFSIDFCNVYDDAQQHAHHYFNYERQELEPRIWEEPTSRNASVIPCTQFQHEAEFHSVITQYDLVCSRDILVSVTQFFHLFGVLTGGILANHLLKYFSPRNVMLFGMVAQIFCGNLTGHVSSYELHVFFRCLSAVSCAQMYTAGGVIMADITGGKYKVCVSTLFEQFWSIGVILLPGVASFFSSWSHLYMAISWPTVILIYLWRWIPDSPRWMIARGRVMDAKKILEQCIEVNGTRSSLPHDIDQQLELQAQTAMDAPPLSGWWTLWRGEKAVRHMICVHLAWSIYIVVYYGMLLNIRAFSREHLEVNTVIAGSCEIIGTFIGLFLILTTKWKWLCAGLFNIVAACIAYTGWLVPYNINFDARVALLMLSAMISKVAISTTLSILTTSTVELVSDDKKKICAFSTICWARFWLLGAPFVGATVIFGDLIPQTAFASLSILGGIFTCLISSPRTLSQPPQSPQQSPSWADSNNGIDNKAFSKGRDDGQTQVAGVQQQSESQPTQHIFNGSTTKMTTQSNLPPQLMPGIWTIKNHEDSTPI